MNEPFGNLTRFKKSLEESEFDAVIAVSPENVAYTGGVFIWSQRTIRERLALVVWPRSGEPTFIVCSVEEPQTKAETHLRDLRSYVEFHKSPIQMLTEVLAEKKLTNSRVGVEMRYLSASYWNELAQLMPNIKFTSCDDFFDRVRMVKSQEEIDRLTKGARATERALLATFATIQAGETEKNMADRLASNMLVVGADKNDFLYINAGPNTGYPHCAGSSYKCQPGDIVKADCGGTFDGYVSDVARTGVIDKPTEEQTSIYNRLREIHAECLDTARPGNRASDIFNTMKKGHERAGLHFPLPHAGHSVGLTGHERPMLTSFEQTVLEPNMMFYIETRVRWVGKMGFHIEDLVLVTEDSPRILTGVFDNHSLFQI